MNKTKKGLAKIANPFLCIQKIPHKKQEELAIPKMPLPFFSGFFPFENRKYRPKISRFNFIP